MIGARWQGSLGSQWGAAPIEAGSLTQYAEQFTFPADTPEETLELEITLAHTPAAGTILTLWLSSSQVNQDRLLTVAPVAAFTITLPAHRPFNASDYILVIYWS